MDFLTSIKLLSILTLVSLFSPVAATAACLSGHVKTPQKTDINQGLTSPNEDFMTSLLGAPMSPAPGKPPSNFCFPLSEATNSRLKRLVTTSSVGPFTGTGLRPFISTLEMIFRELKEKDPELYSRIRTAGILCIRPKKNPDGSYRMGSWSNHSWGTAVDIKVGGKLDEYGDDCTLSDLLRIYPYMHKAGLYWGAGFSGGREDSMHFEASQELLEKWKSNGRLD